MSRHSLSRRNFLRTSVVAYITGAACSDLTRVLADDTRPKPILKRRALSKTGYADYEIFGKVFDVIKKKSEILNILTSQVELYAKRPSRENWFFLPWVRAQLYFFESICREQSGDNQFTIPYWDVVSTPFIPQHFLKEGSPLFYPGRRALSSIEKLAADIASPDSVARVLETKSFVSFGGDEPSKGIIGVVESSVHNYLHAFIGGDMATDKAPLDPLFWVSHAYLDCLWARWQKAHSSPRVAPKESSWLNKEFYFLDAKKKEDCITTKALLDTTNLGYEYDLVAK
jgi:hypothetical protein